MGRFRARARRAVVHCLTDTVRVAPWVQQGWQFSSLKVRTPSGLPVIGSSPPQPGATTTPASLFPDLDRPCIRTPYSILHVALRHRNQEVRCLFHGERLGVRQKCRMDRRVRCRPVALVVVGVVR